jgi:ankyrin repeat protein
LSSVALDFSDGDSSLDSDDRNLPVDNVDARLLDAARLGHEEVVKLLLETAKIDVDSKSSGRTPLSWAAENGHEAVVKLVLEKGAELETKDTENDQTPLSWAAANGHEAVVKLLLEKGAKKP